MKARVPVGIDLPAVEGRYHRKCFQSFFKDREKPRFDKTSTPISKRGRNVDELKSNTLNAVILELEGSNDGVKSMNDIAKTLEETVARKHDTAVPRFHWIRHHQSDPRSW